MEPIGEVGRKCIAAGNDAVAVKPAHDICRFDMGVHCLPLPTNLYDK
jgi:hypothetical protein